SRMPRSGRWSTENSDAVREATGGGPLGGGVPALPTAGVSGRGPVAGGVVPTTGRGADPGRRGHRRAQWAGGGAQPLGVLEVLRPAPARRRSVEPQEAVASLSHVGSQSAASIEAPGSPTTPAAPGGAGGRQPGVVCLPLTPSAASRLNFRPA